MNNDPPAAERIKELLECRMSNVECRMMNEGILSFLSDYKCWSAATPPIFIRNSSFVIPKAFLKFDDAEFYR